MVLVKYLDEWIVFADNIFGLNGWTTHGISWGYFMGYLMEFKQSFFTTLRVSKNGYPKCSTPKNCGHLIVSCFFSIQLGPSFFLGMILPQLLRSNSWGTWISAVCPVCCAVARGEGEIRIEKVGPRPPCRWEKLRIRDSMSPENKLALCTLCKTCFRMLRNEGTLRGTAYSLPLLHRSSSLTDQMSQNPLLLWPPL